jgi:hypothetical protein
LIQRFIHINEERSSSADSEPAPDLLRQVPAEVRFVLGIAITTSLTCARTVIRRVSFS